MTRTEMVAVHESILVRWNYPETIKTELRRALAKFLARATTT